MLRPFSKIDTTAVTVKSQSAGSVTRKDNGLPQVRDILAQITEDAKPGISVITPVLNGEKHIESCIKNVVTQALPDRMEHIIYDGGSSDKTVAIVRQWALRYPHIRLISVPGTNQGKAMNEAIKAAGGSIIGILNADDFYNPGVLNEVLEEFKSLPQGSFLVGNTRFLNEKNETLRVNRPSNLNFNDIVWERSEYPSNSSAYFYHKSLHGRIGNYDENEDHAMGLDFVLRVLREAHVVYRDRDWGNCRYIPGTKTFKADGSAQTAMISKRVFDRYRREGVPKISEHLPGTLWGITAYFNPDGNKKRRENYLKFRASSQRQGLKLIAVELEFDNHSFELKEGDADILMQITGGDRNYIWQKEALLNMALGKLPEDCDKVAWLDSDILFKNENWVNETGQLLEKYKVLQLFSWAIHLREGKDDEDPVRVPFGWGDAEQFYSMGYRVAEYGQAAIGEYRKSGHPGFGWAIQRKVIDQIRFLDCGIFQHNDTLMAYGFYGSNVHFQRSLNSCLPPETSTWIHRAWEMVRGSVYYCPGVILHLWHGSLQSRMYVVDRREHLMALMKISGFDFNRDLYKNKNGLWEWTASSGGIFKEELKRFYQGHSSAVIGEVLPMPVPKRDEA